MKSPENIKWRIQLVRAAIDCFDMSEITPA